MGAAIGSIPGARAVHVPRSRFAPVKTTDDLLVVRSDAYELSSAGRMRPSFDGPGPVVTLDKEFYKLLPDFARVVWRCHIGVDWENEVTRAGWEFLRPHLAAAEAYVFSRQEYVPSWIPAGKAWIIPPSIDPFSPKNQPLDPGTVRAMLVRLGVLVDAVPAVPARLVRRDGAVGMVTRPAVIIGDSRPGPGDPVLVQVSRWDRLKDMAGVMRGFAGHVAPDGNGYLMLVGPAVKDVSDDPEGAAVYGECLLQWRNLSRGLSNNGTASGDSGLKPPG